ncbi:aspartate aminotransferase [Stella humosa]|uniref:Aminotransferase n=1 Tax=Stella humosa TaxID=94 RepID=A0A3N1MDE0_9PROT|nr:aminotransferase class I/II-fold pyridoxal phosphate-dependent enzyme [Stella humosa]ROQ01733.1 aspartate aminotransferase [Stella humosa]BBK32115.1 aminotransferase [Stella humosa]
MSSSYLATRMKTVAPSASGAAAQRARALAAAGRDIINLTAGEPDFDTPAHIQQAANDAIARGETRYTNVDGTDALKRAIIGKFARENGLDYSPAEVMAGTGAKQLIFNAFLATLDVGDEVIIPAPCWVSYPEMVKLMGGTPVVVPCSENAGFKLDAEQLAAAITPRTKWLTLNTPNNPSGSVYSEAELQALGRVLQDHPGILVMTDDIYEHILFDGGRFSTMAAAVPALRDRVLTINGVSKAYSMTGWRIGYAAGPADLIRAMKTLQSQSTSCASAVSQAAAVEALNGPQDLVAKRNAEFRDRRDLIVGELATIPGLSCLSPQGAFYVYPSCAGLIGKRTPEGTVIRTDEDFVAYLLESQGVAVVAGSPYGLSPYFRISFAVSEETLRKAAARIRTACESLQ